VVEQPVAAAMPLWRGGRAEEMVLKGCLKARAIAPQLPEPGPGWPLPDSASEQRLTARVKEARERIREEMQRDRERGREGAREHGRKEKGGREEEEMANLSEGAA
jgi:hypothetical protein